MSTTRSLISINCKPSSPIIQYKQVPRSINWCFSTYYQTTFSPFCLPFFCTLSSCEALSASSCFLFNCHFFSIKKSVTTFESDGKILLLDPSSLLEHLPLSSPTPSLAVALWALLVSESDLPRLAVGLRNLVEYVRLALGAPALGARGLDA
jgi:hypothetical protein